jgi:hypothetical protein
MVGTEIPSSSLLPKYRAHTIPQSKSAIRTPWHDQPFSFCWRSRSYPHSALKELRHLRLLLCLFRSCSLELRHQNQPFGEDSSRQNVSRRKNFAVAYVLSQIDTNFFFSGTSLLITQLLLAFNHSAYHRFRHSRPAMELPSPANMD